jgi:hypothetical protein
MKDREVKDVKVLEQEKQGLLSRLFGLKKKIQEDEAARLYKAEVEKIESRVKTIDEQILDSIKQQAKGKVLMLEEEGLRLVEEKLKLLKRVDEINDRLDELRSLCLSVIPTRKVQVSSQKTVKMIQTITENELIGFKKEPIMEGPGIPGADKTIPIFKQKVQTVEHSVPCVPSTIENCREHGWELAPGEEIPEEPLTDENSISIPVFATPDVLS